MSIALKGGKDVARLENAFREAERDVESYALIAAVRMSSTQWVERSRDPLRYLVDNRVVDSGMVHENQSNSRLVRCVLGMVLEQHKMHLPIPCFTNPFFIASGTRSVKIGRA